MNHFDRPNVWLAHFLENLIDILDKFRKAVIFLFFFMAVSLRR